jgi:NAD(P)-dependent dehydrogenase (short-subunit alcohol dehydrogenase family)
VNNAGIFPAANTLTADPEMFDRVYAVNVKAPFFLTQAVAPTMIANGGGVIINLGSWVARLSVPVGALYASTKGANLGEAGTSAFAYCFANSRRVPLMSTPVTRKPLRAAAAAVFP